MTKFTYVLLLPLILVLLLTSGIHIAYGQDVTPTPTTSNSTITPTPDNSGAISDLQDKIKGYKDKISDLQGQEKTLSSQIGIMNNQIKLGELKIQETQQKLAELEGDISSTRKRITGLESELTETTKALIGRIGATYQVGKIDPWQVFLTSNNVSNFLTRLTYLKLVQANDKRNIYAAQQSKQNYTHEKTILEEKQQEVKAAKTELEGYAEKLNQDKASKQTLLSETQGNESTYQKLLSQAQTQLAGFSRFTENQGGAALLSGQTNCDDWGCYYNQRDSQWGGMALNNTQYSLASDGCLVTAMAMVYTHYGHKDVTPISINSNSSNFASYYPAYLLYSISANGTNASRAGASIDSTLASGNPVVVGLRAYGGTHFVVLISGSNGDYIMHDPYLPNGHNVKFSDHYTVGSIYEVSRVNF